MSISAQQSLQLPLCIDMDGSLLLTDTLWEACLRLVARNPLYLLLMPFWLFGGKAAFKHKISQRVTLAYDALPVNQRLLDYIKEQKAGGREIVLITAADQKIANGVADQLNVFDRIYASDGQLNLSGQRKAEKLTEVFGKQAFVYAGNAAIDLAIWQAAAAAITVNAPAQLVNQVRSSYTHEADFPAEHRDTIKYVLRAFRPHQWVKNLLLFVPLVLSHKLEPQLILNSLLAFIAFCLTASAIYIVNDLFDLEADRRHTSKRNRPFASGALPIIYGIVLSTALIILAALITTNINLNFALVLLAYLLLTTIYTIYLKHIVLVDVLTLTSLYTVRILAGAAAVSVPVSYWLLAFSIFIFMSLGLTKRYIELQKLLESSDLEQKARDYTIHDLPVVLLFGVCSGFIGVMVLVLYINDLHASKLYSQPTWLWIVGMAILYWINRIWLLTHRGELNEDPVLFAIRDQASYVTALVILISMYLAI